jgi:hypothetical protein
VSQHPRRQLHAGAAIAEGDASGAIVLRNFKRSGERFA